MLELDLLTLSLLLLVGFIGGTVDSIAGGGGLITLPALLATGMSPAMALGTNKLQSCFGSFSATRFFIKQKLINLHDMRLAVICTFIGSATGTLLVQQIDATALSQLLPLLLTGFALYFLFSKRVKDEDSQRRIGEAAFALIFGTAIGFYDGFFGPGTGSFFAIAFVSLAGFGMAKATAHTKLLNFTSNIAALLFFALGGHVAWGVGLTMAVGQFLGGRLGSGLVVAKGTTLIKPLIVCVSTIMSARLLYQAYPEWFGWLG